MVAQRSARAKKESRTIYDVIIYTHWNHEKARRNALAQVSGSLIPLKIYGFSEILFHFTLFPARNSARLDSQLAELELANSDHGVREMWQTASGSTLRSSQVDY